MTKNKTKKEEYPCEICGREISKEEYETYDGMCWENLQLKYADHFKQPEI